ncbi:TIGR00730 family Rossman fold protein [Candidatus Woesearchaeota archaeon CG10_big_fil_rev_8_21_14_0_10_44_13]|nr:MAG: TIGR00730 family Rossman fold protein [Candidatus Woesearchaeota archaeon CG10_big_fil_rev_8_21_14_0_10_44_13]
MVNMSRLHKNKQYYTKTDWTVDKVREEINSGLKLLNKIDNKIITFFGSHRVTKNSKYYQHCEKVSFELGKRGYAILSGGGPGIMHAANSGATKAKVPSIGLKAGLLKGERVTDKIFTHEMSFHFLFVRRFIMSIKSEALIFYPGGYGTLNELFEYAVLMQTGIVDNVPIICVNKKYWQGLFDWLENNPLKEDFFIHDIKDLKLIHFVDGIDEIISIIENK